MKNNLCYCSDTEIPHQHSDGRIIQKAHCEFCKKYDKTWYYSISRFKKWPKNLISARPFKIFGVYIFSIMKLATKDYQWGKTIEDYKKEYYNDEYKHYYLCPIHESLIFAKEQHEK